MIQPQCNGDSSVISGIWDIAQIQPKIYAALCMCSIRASHVGGKERISRSPLYLKMSDLAKSIVAASTAG